MATHSGAHDINRNWASKCRIVNLQCLYTILPYSRNSGSHKTYHNSIYGLNYTINSYWWMANMIVFTLVLSVYMAFTERHSCSFFVYWPLSVPCTPFLSPMSEHDRTYGYTCFWAVLNLIPQ